MSEAFEESVSGVVPTTLKLPNMNEFSPGSLGTSSIRQFLSMLKPHIGDRNALLEFIKTIPQIAATSTHQNKNRANNVLIGMRQCKLLKDEPGHECEFTSVSNKILAASNDIEASRLFTKHIIENLHGMELIDVVGTLRDRGVTRSLDNIRTELRLRGFVVTENEGNPSKLRLWMEASGVIDKNWQLNETSLKEVVGASSTTLAEWNGLTRSQRIFLTMLRQLSESDPSAWCSVRTIKRQSEAAYGRSVFPEGHLRKLVLGELIDKGWIEARGKGVGRGGDSGEVKPRSKLTSITASLPFDTITNIPADLRPHLAKPLEEIFSELKSPSTDIKGRALELLALNLLRDIGLFPVGFRQRAGTFGAEVDLLANGIHLHYSRWIFQCKNKPHGKVDTRDIAEEVGMAIVLKAQVIAVVTTGKFTQSAKTFADGVAASSNLQIICIDGETLKKYRESRGPALIDWLRLNALHVLALKEAQIRD